MNVAEVSSKTFLCVFHTPWRYAQKTEILKSVATITKSNEATF